MFVMTVDQKGSRRGADLVESLLGALHEVPTRRAFERTAGDEVQGVLDDAATVVDVALLLARSRQWSVGIGCGPVELPLPPTSRAGRGEAFVLAREAVNRAKNSLGRVAVVGVGASAEPADALLSLLADVVHRRSESGWEAVDLLRTGGTQSSIAERLGVSKQAVSSRLRVAMWTHEQRLRPLLAELLVAAADDGQAAP